MPWEIPEPLATGEVRTADGSLIVLRRHGNPDGPRLVLSHGNGLAIDLYYPFWSRLTERFDLVVHDFRSHGWNPRAPLRSHHFPTFVWDNEYVVRGIDHHFGVKPKIGVFHSMSALTALYHALRSGPRFAALVLFDPPFSPPNGDRLESEYLDRESELAARTRRRQARFETREEFAEVVRGASAFARLLPGVPDLYARATLRPAAAAAADGRGYELCCPREHEAQVFDTYLDSSFELAMGSFPCPLKLIGGDPTIPDAFVPSIVLKDVARRCDLDYDYVPGASHFLQLEKPAECAALMLEFLERQGLA